jgi:hypothetical protein
MTNLSFITDILKKLVPQGQEQGSSALPVIGPTPTNPVNPAPVAQFPSPVTTPGFNPNAGPIPGIETLGGYQPTEPAQLPQITPPAPASSETGPTAALPVIGPDVTTRERVVAEPPPITRPLTPEQKLAALDAKDYSIQKDENGNVIHRGKNRDKKWSLADKILSAVAGWATGGLAGGIKAGTDRNYFEKMGDQFQRERILPQIAAKQQIGKYESDVADAQKRRENIDVDNQYQKERLNEFGKDRERKEGDRASRERTTRMNAVAGMFKNIPAFDPADPKFAEMKQALGDVNLPVTPKDAKKKVDLKQDQRTGAWTVILTNPTNGEQEVRSVLKDGKPFTSTPTVVMQGEYGMLKQDDAQGFQAQEAQKKRDFEANMESAKLQARAAFKNLETAQGRLKALETERAKFIAAYRKETGGQMPTDQQVNEYLNAVGGQ